MRRATRFAVLTAPALICAVWTVAAGKDVNWDLLNYHYYLPYEWLHGRLQQDYFAASPADKLAQRSGSFTAGIRVFDISRPEKPAEIGFLAVDGIGPHRIWYTGGRYAYASIHFADFTDHILAVIDMSNPRKPAIRLSRTTGRVSAVLAVHSMPFIAFEKKNLEAMASLAGYFADLVAHGGQASDAERGRREIFKVRLLRALRDVKDRSIPSVVGCLWIQRAAPVSDKPKASAV